MKTNFTPFVISTAILLASCQESPASEKIQKPITAEVGRFAFYPASEDMPAVLLDTATGCIEQFVKLTNVNNAKDITWGRRYLEISMPSSSMAGYSVPTENSADPKSGRLPIGTLLKREDIAPPLRCGSAQLAKK